MKILSAVSLAVPLLLSSLSARADSPITSTPIADAYLDVPEVAAARASGTLTPELSRALAESRLDLGTKAAIVNALSWKLEGKDNARVFKAYLAKGEASQGQGQGQGQDQGQNGDSPLDLSRLTADQLFSLGYLTVMDDYFQPERAIPYLEQAAAKDGRSKTISLVLALTRAQAALNSDWCEVWTVTASVLNDGTLAQDIRPAAVDIVHDYIKGYESSCTEQGNEKP